MTPESPSLLERLLCDNDLGWMVDMYEPREDAIPFLLGQLAKVTSEFKGRFGCELSFMPESLAAESERNPHKVRAFLQALGVSRNPDMLVMVWRILQGLNIRKVSMDYVAAETFRLTVTLGRGNDEVEEYQTGDIRDAALLRHFGITLVEKRPLFDGFFPLRKK